MVGDMRDGTLWHLACLDQLSRSGTIVVCGVRNGRSWQSRCMNWLSISGVAIVEVVRERHLDCLSWLSRSNTAIVGGSIRGRGWHRIRVCRLTGERWRQSRVRGLLTDCPYKHIRTRFSIANSIVSTNLVVLNSDHVAQYRKRVENRCSQGWPVGLMDCWSYSRSGSQRAAC